MRGLEGGLVEEGLVLRSWAMRSAARRSLEATRSTPRRGAEEHLGGGIAEDLLGGAGGLERVVDGGGEGVAIERVEADLGGDAGGEGGVLVHVEAAGEWREADEPEGQEVAAVEGEVEEAGEVEEEGVGEVLRLVDDDDGGGAALVDHVDEGLLDVGPELPAAMGGLDAELAGEGAVEIERRDGGVAEVEDEVVGPGKGMHRLRMAAVLPTPASAERTPRPGSSRSCWKARPRRP